MRTLPLLAAALSLAACQQEVPAEEAPAKPIVVRSAQQDGLVAADEMTRAITLKRAIVANGYRCQRVEESHFVGQYKNMDVWAASCGDKRVWALFVGADDSVQIRLCKDVAQVGLPSCDTRGTPPTPRKAAPSSPATKKPAEATPAG